MRPTWREQWCPSCVSKDCEECTLPHRNIKPTKYEGGEVT